MDLSKMIEALLGRASSNDTARNLVSRYSKGNVSLQNGKYVTANEKDRRKKELMKIKFS